VERWATFDCYGTLVDWNGGIRAELARIFGEEEADAKLAAYHELEPVVEEGEPTLSYREVMARVLERLGAPAGERDALGASLPRWEVFPEAARALEQARARGWRFCILSNTDRDFIDASMTAIGVPFDRSIVASEIGSYKPAHGHWQAFEKEVGRLPDAHVAASLFHDVAPTSELGIPCFWINRLGEDRDGYAPTREAPTLVSLAEVLDELAP
jgi:2-haloacid dehalogenase